MRNTSEAVCVNHTALSGRGIPAGKFQFNIC